MQLAGCKIDGGRSATGDGKRAKSCSACMDGDPPFVGMNDAEALTEIGTSCPLPGSIILVTPLKNGKKIPTIS